MVHAAVSPAPDERARQKQASRDEDASRLKACRVGPSELAAENGFFHSLPIRSFRIVSIGRRPFNAAA